MSKAKITPARAAVLKAKTASIASKLPATRNTDGSIKPRDKTGGKGPANVGKPWSDSDDTRLRNLVAQGKQSAAIAEVLGRTEAGVQARIETLKIFKGGDTPPEKALKVIEASLPSAMVERAARAKAAGDKPGNGKHPETLAQVTAPATPADKAPAAVVATQEPAAAAPAATETEAEALAPAQELELPLNFVKAALSIAPKDDTRYYLNGVYVQQLDDLVVRLVATDGHRLFVSSFEQKTEIAWARPGVILPREELERIVKYVGKDAPGLRVEFGVNHPSLKIHEIAGMAVFTLKAIDGKYPDYQRVVDSAASVFSAEREELQQTTLDSSYLKAAGALAAVLESKGIIPFLATEESAPSVFAFADRPEALLYIMGQRNDRPALAAPTIKLFGAAAMQATLEKLEEQITRTEANAKAAKHEKFRKQFEDKAARLRLRAEQIRSNLLPALPAPAASQSPPAAPAEAAGGVAVH